MCKFLENSRLEPKDGWRFGSDDFPFQTVDFQVPSVNFSERKFAAETERFVESCFRWSFGAEIVDANFFCLTSCRTIFIKRKASPNIWLRKTFGSTMVPSLRFSSGILPCFLFWSVTDVSMVSFFGDVLVYLLEVG